MLVKYDGLIVLAESNCFFGIGGKLNTSNEVINSELFENKVYSLEINDMTTNSHRDVISKQLSKINGEQVDLIAHRGFKDERPENTMVAFENAVNKGCFHLECDVNISSDGIPFLFHDSTLDRTTNGTGSTYGKTFAELQLLEAGGYTVSGSSHDSTAYKNEKIPSFEAFCKYAKEKNCYIYPEIKHIRTQADINLINNIIIKYGLSKKTMIQSFDYTQLAYVKSINPDIQLGYLSYSTIDKALMIAGSCALIEYTALLNDKTYAKDLRQNGFDVGVWTINLPDYLFRVAENGVNKIMSDNSIYRN